MIPRLKPALGWQEIKAALTWPRNDDVPRFEKAFAEKMGQKHAVAFPYGRTGLVLLLEALDLKGKEIICPAYTCVVVPHAIVTSGNVPVFVDSQEEDFNMNLDLVPEAINENTSAIIATSIFGYPVDLDKLAVISQKYPHVQIIQDCAHSFAAEWKGRPVQREGVAAIFGLNISKLMTSIFGGMVTTDDDVLYERLRQLRNERLQPASVMKSLRRLIYLFAIYPSFWPPIYGLVNRLERSGVLDRFTKYYDEGVIDMPEDYLEQMSKVEARVGVTQLQKYNQIVEKRVSVTQEYFAELKAVDNLMLPPCVNGATYSHFVTQVDDRSICLAKALKAGVQLGQLIEYAIPQLRAYRQDGTNRYFPFARSYAKRTINLPVFFHLDKSQQQQVVRLWKKS